MEFNPVVARKNEAGVFAIYQPTLEVPKQYKEIVLEWDLEKHVAVVTLNRPDVYNALSVEIMEETIDALHMAEENSEISCIILRPAGEQFCTGGDFNRFTGKDLLTQRWYFEIPPKVLRTMMDITVPIIGVIRGNCCAFGLGICGSCDIVFASDNSVYFLPGGDVGFGCFTPCVGAYKSVQRKRMFELLITARPHSAQWAYDAGLVNYVYPDEEVDRKAWEMAELIGEHAPLVVRWEKQFFYAIQDMEHHKAYRYGTEVITMQSLTRDGYEGQTAFLQKREPVWKGSKGGSVRGDTFVPEEEHVWHVGDEERKA
jgi:enoyl-CoA hydratase/carnithine racemase